MMMFWIVALLFVVAALLFLLPPLLQGAGGAKSIDRRRMNIEIYKDQLAELENDLQNGVLSREQYDTARADMERSLLNDVDSKAANSTEKTPTIDNKTVAIIVGVFIPVMAGVFYSKLGGGPAAFNPELAAAQQASAEQHQGNNLEEMLAKLEERVAADANDGEAVSMLARTYYFMRRNDDALKMFARAMQVTGGNDPNLLADYADALAVQNGRNLNGEPLAMLKKALTLDPYHVKALWLAGTAGYQSQDYKSALEFWDRLVVLMEPGSEDEQQVQNNINEVKTLLGMKVTPTASKTAVASVSGSVALDPSLKGKVSANDTVFIFARAASGPPMPLAVIRKQVKDLPMQFSLDDSMAMNPAMKLSSFPQVVVGARVSKSGNAMPQSGDLQVLSPVVSSSAGASVKLVINSVVP